MTVDHLRAAIVGHVRESVKEQVAEIHVQVLDPQESMILPAGVLQMRVKPNSPESLFGRRSFDLGIEVNGKQIQSVPVVADVNALADVVVTTRVVKSDEVLDADDVIVMRTKIQPGMQGFIVSATEAIGKRAVRPIQAQMPVMASALGQPFVVRKGDRVTIEAKRGGLLIQATGMTKATGQVGQFLTVTNLDSGRDIRAKVTGPGLVRVEY